MGTVFVDASDDVERLSARIVEAVRTQRVEPRGGGAARPLAARVSLGAPGLAEVGASWTGWVVLELDPAPAALTDVTLLPAPPALERICKGIAILDAILSAEWTSRAYSFNACWNDAGTEHMASMRNGQGDEWFMLFSPGREAFLKAFCHEFPHEDPAVIYADLPPTLARQRVEPAFQTELVTFGGFHDGERWTLRGNAGPVRRELAVLRGDPFAFRLYADDSHEDAEDFVQPPIEAIAHVLRGDPLDPSIIEALGSERDLDALEDDLEEIAYGR